MGADRPATLGAAIAACAATIAVIKRRPVGSRTGHPRSGRAATLIDDQRVLPHHKLVLRALARYLALPLDLIPDFIPIIGRLDDGLIVALAIRTAMRSANA